MKTSGAKNKINQSQKLRWYSQKETFRKASKTKQFKEVFKEESARIKLAKQIRALRNAKKLTQKAVADKAQMPQSVLARIESGEHSISVETLNRVATALGKEIQLV